MSSPMQGIFERWAETAAPALSALLSIPVRIAVEPVSSQPDLAGHLCWRQTMDAAPEAALFAAAPSRLWRKLGQAVLSAAGVDDAEDSDLHDTYLEALQVAISCLPPILGQRIRREVNLSPGAESNPQEGVSWVAFSIELGDEASGSLLTGFNPSLVQTLEREAPAAPPADPPAAPAPAPAPNPGSKPRPAGATHSNSRTLDLLLEVELPVGVSFGRTQMRVKDAIKLTTGSIVELNRNVSAPVEIVVNNCVIARGEVVVVEGNYGVRIQEIISREERLRTLF